jgi:hypothetical protein
VGHPEAVSCFRERRVCHTKVVPEYCTCGSQLPPDARFCHKCGKPQYDYPGLEQETVEPVAPLEAAASPAVAVQPPLEISFHNRLAVRIGFLAALMAVLPFMLLLPVPFLPSLVAFLTGFLAVFIYSRLTGQALSIRSGARMGWITGVFSFTFATAFFTITMVAISSQGKIADFFREHQDQLHLRGDQLSAMTKLLDDPAGLVGLIVVTLLMLFILLTALPMLGGALGAKVLEKE